MDVLQEILGRREEYLMASESHHGGRGEGNPFAGLFHGFPSLPDDPDPFVISSRTGANGTKITAHVRWLSQERDKEGNFNFVQRSPDDPDADIHLVVETDDGVRIHRFGDSSMSLELRKRGRDTGRGCHFLGPYSGASTDELGVLWDRIAISDDEQIVIEALRIIDPHISKVAMVGGENGRGRRTAIVRADNIPRPVPLRSFGDGMNRLFSMILAIIGSRGKIMLIDEFENGLHHTVQ